MCLRQSRARHPNTLFDAQLERQFLTIRTIGHGMQYSRVSAALVLTRRLARINSASAQKFHQWNFLYVAALHIASLAGNYDKGVAKICHPNCECINNTTLPPIMLGNLS